MTLTFACQLADRREVLALVKAIVVGQTFANVLF